MTVAKIQRHIISGVQIFPDTNVWNRPILDLPIHASSATWLSAIGAAVLQAKTATTDVDGIPYNVVTNSTPTYVPTLTYATRGYSGAFPIPASPRYEAGVDHHLLCLNTDTGICYEMGGYNGGAPGAVTGDAAWAWDLSSNALPGQMAGDDPIAANAASMSLLAGLLFYDEIAAGVITHALYICLPLAAGAYSEIWPAKHNDGSQAGYPPQGARFRLKASKDISGFSAVNQIILTALKTYGGFNCDGGSLAQFRMQGVADARWNTTDLANLSSITTSDFEAVDESGIIINSASGQAQGIKAFSLFGI